MKTTKHIFIRGNYRQDIFFDTIDFICAWNRIIISAFAVGVEILAIEILANHLHICIRYESDEVRSGTGGPCLSKFMHYLRMSLSLYFNYRYKVHGSLGSRRYGSANVVDIDDDGGEDLRDLIRYIVRNVTHHGISANYREWKFGTFQFVFGIFDGSDCYVGSDIPDNLRKAYLPMKFIIPKNWAMTKSGMIVPPADVFPREDIEKLFISKSYYLKACDTPTVREREDQGEMHERKLGYVSSAAAKPTDQQLMDYIAERSLIPIVSMNRDQCITAIKTILRAYPKTTLAQLSRIFHTPKTTIQYWLG